MVVGIGQISKIEELVEVGCDFKKKHGVLDGSMASKELLLGGCAL